MDETANTAASWRCQPEVVTTTLLALPASSMS
jgi:hypothetical protein